MSESTTAPVGALASIIEHEDGERSCGRCGSSAEWLRCWKCGGEGLDGHDCGDDCCACLHPEENVVCDMCRGVGGSWHCVSGPDWCEAHPRPGREQVPSTALRAEAWDD